MEELLEVPVEELCTLPLKWLFSLIVDFLLSSSFSVLIVIILALRAFASFISCVISTIVMPFLCKSSNIFLNRIADSKSKPALGSSKTSIFGLYAKTPAIATRRCCPPESSKGENCAKCSICSIFKVSFTLLLSFSPSKPKFLGP